MLDPRAGRRRCAAVLLLGVLLALVLAACGDSDSPVAPGDPFGTPIAPGDADNPNPTMQTDAGTYRFAADAMMVPRDGSVETEEVGDGRLVLSGAVPDDIDVGSVLLGTEGEGYLVKVTGVEEETGRGRQDRRLVLATEQAEFADLFQEAELRFSEEITDYVFVPFDDVETLNGEPLATPLTKDDLLGPALPADSRGLVSDFFSAAVDLLTPDNLSSAVKIDLVKTELEVGRKIEEALRSYGVVEVGLAAKIGLRLPFEFELIIRDSTLIKYRTMVGLKVDAAIEGTLAGGGTISFQKRSPLRLGVIKGPIVFVGPVPATTEAVIILQPEFGGKLQATYKVIAGLEGAGGLIGYDFTRPGPPLNGTGGGFTADPDTLAGFLPTTNVDQAIGGLLEIELFAPLGGQAGSRLLGVAGPETELKVGPSFKVQAEGSVISDGQPFQTIKLAADLAVKLEVSGKLTAGIPFAGDDFQTELSAKLFDSKLSVSGFPTELTIPLNGAVDATVQ